MGCLLVAVEAKGAVLSASLDVGDYGWLDQYSLGAVNDGSEDCAPTSSTNAMTFLQNYYAGYFGSGGLTGTTYQEWEDTDEFLRGSHYMDSDDDGTGEAAFIYGLHKYVKDYKGFDGVEFSGMYYFDEWTDSGYTRPDFIEAGPPSVEFIFSSLEAGSAFIANLRYPSGGGHVLAINGITWNTETLTGTLSFVDPLDPTFYDGSGQPEGPAKQTSATISMHGSEIELVYDQYHGALPWTDDYRNATALIHGGLAVAVPEPSTYALVTLGVAGLVAWRRRWRR